jgi:hypothetical protein
MSKIVVSLFVFGLTFSSSFSQKRIFSQEFEIKENSDDNKKAKKVSKDLLFLNLLKSFQDLVTLHKNPLEKIEEQSLEKYADVIKESNVVFLGNLTAFTDSFSSGEFKELGEKMGNYAIKHAQGIFKALPSVLQEAGAVVNKIPSALIFITLSDVIFSVYSPIIVLLVNFFVEQYSLNPEDVKKVMPSIVSLRQKYADKKFYDESTYVKLDAKAVPRANLEVWKDAIILVLQKTHSCSGMLSQEHSLFEKTFVSEILLKSQIMNTIFSVSEKLLKTQEKRNETISKYDGYLICFLSESIQNFYKNNKKILFSSIWHDLTNKDKAFNASIAVGILIQNLEKEMEAILDSVYGKDQKTEQDGFILPAFA